MLNLKQTLIRICDLTFQHHSSIYVGSYQFDHAWRIDKSVLVAKNLELSLLSLFLLVIIAKNPIFFAMS
jgi:hypothetical protein